MEVDCDVYENLEPEGPSLCEQIDDLQGEIHQLQKHIASLESDVAKLCAKITDMRKVEANLTKNISELYKTAKAEIDRKDRTIAELRSQLDNVLFRRNIRYNTEPSPSCHTVKRSRENSPGSYKSTNDFNPKRPKREYDNPDREKSPTLHKSEVYNIKRPMKDYEYRESSPSSYKSNNDYNSNRAKREYDNPSRENSPSLRKTEYYNTKRSMRDREYLNRENSPSFSKSNSDFNPRKYGHAHFRSKSPPRRKSRSRSREHRHTNVDRSRDKNKEEKNISDKSYASDKKQPLIREAHNRRSPNKKVAKDSKEISNKNKMIEDSQKSDEKTEEKLVEKVVIKEIDSVETEHGNLPKVVEAESVAKKISNENTDNDLKLSKLAEVEGSEEKKKSYVCNEEPKLTKIAENKNIAKNTTETNCKGYKTLPISIVSVQSPKYKEIKLTSKPNDNEVNKISGETGVSKSLENKDVLKECGESRTSTADKSRTVLDNTSEKSFKNDTNKGQTLAKPFEDKADVVKKLSEVAKSRTVLNKTLEKNIENDTYYQTLIKRLEDEDVAKKIPQEVDKSRSDLKKVSEVSSVTSFIKESEKLLRPCDVRHSAKKKFKEAVSSTKNKTIKNRTPEKNRKIPFNKGDTLLKYRKVEDVPEKGMSTVNKYTTTEEKPLEDGVKEINEKVDEDKNMADINKATSINKKDETSPKPPEDKNRTFGTENEKSSKPPEDNVKMITSANREDEKLSKPLETQYAVKKTSEENMNFTDKENSTTSTNGKEQKLYISIEGRLVSEKVSKETFTSSKGEVLQKPMEKKETSMMSQESIISTTNQDKNLPKDALKKTPEEIKRRTERMKPRPNIVGVSRKAVQKPMEIEEPSKLSQESIIAMTNQDKNFPKSVENKELPKKTSEEPKRRAESIKSRPNIEDVPRKVVQKSVEIEESSKMSQDSVEVEEASKISQESIISTTNQDRNLPKSTENKDVLGKTSEEIKRRAERMKPRPNIAAVSRKVVQKPMEIEEISQESITAMTNQDKNLSKPVESKEIPYKTSEEPKRRAERIKSRQNIEEVPRKVVEKPVEIEETSKMSQESIISKDLPKKTSEETKIRAERTKPRPNITAVSRKILQKPMEVEETSKMSQESIIATTNQAKNLPKPVENEDLPKKTSEEPKRRAERIKSRQNIEDAPRKVVQKPVEIEETSKMSQESMEIEETSKVSQESIISKDLPKKTSEETKIRAERIKPRPNITAVSRKVLQKPMEVEETSKMSQESIIATTNQAKNLPKPVENEDLPKKTFEEPKRKAERIKSGSNIEGVSRKVVQRPLEIEETSKMSLESVEIEETSKMSLESVEIEETSMLQESIISTTKKTSEETKRRASTEDVSSKVLQKPMEVEETAKMSQESVTSTTNQDKNLPKPVENQDLPKKTSEETKGRAERIKPRPNIEDVTRKLKNKVDTQENKNTDSAYYADLENEKEPDKNMVDFVSRVAFGDDPKSGEKSLKEDIAEKEVNVATKAMKKEYKANEKTEAHHTSKDPEPPKEKNTKPDKKKETKVDSKSKKTKDPRERTSSTNKKDKSEEDVPESDRVLRSAARRNSYNKSDRSSDKIIEEISEMKKKEIFSDPINTVSLTHEGDIPILHLSDNESSFIEMNVSIQNCTSTPSKKEVNMELLKEDLNISLDKSGIEDSNKLFGHSNTLNLSSKSDGAINNLSGESKVFNTSSRRRNRRVVITMMD